MIDYNRIASNEKQKNILMVLNHIALNEESYAADITKATGLSVATVSRSLAALKEKGIVAIKGKEITGMGRHPEIIVLNCDYGCLLHFHVDADSIKSYLTDFCGNILALEQIETDRNLKPDDFGKKLRKSADNLLKKCGIEYGKALAASIAIPGLVDVRNHVIKRIPNFTNFNGVDLFKYVEKAMKVPVIINNTARLSAFGAFIHDYPGKPNLVYFDFTKYSGIGAGIVVDGKLVSGRNGFAGEIGDILVDIQNFENEYHEDEGCLETMAGLGVLYSKLYALMKRGRAAILKELMAEEGTDTVNLNLIEKAIALHDMDVTDVFDDTMRKWAIAVINLSATLDPDLLILGGVVNTDNNLVLSRIRHYISKILFHDADIVLGETNEYQMYGGMHILKAHVFNTMLTEKLFAE